MLQCRAAFGRSNQFGRLQLPDQSVVPPDFYSLSVGFHIANLTGIYDTFKKRTMGKYEQVEVARLYLLDVNEPALQSKAESRL